MYKGRRDFRSGRTLVVLMVVATLLFAAGAVVTYRDRGWTWVSVSLAFTILLGIGGVIETLVVRVQLTDDALIITDLKGRHRYPAAEIERIEEARGVAPAILLTNGRWVTLPVGDSIGNSVRAWLRHVRPT